MFDISSPNIISVILVNGTLEVVKRYQSNMTYCSSSPVPDRVVKEIYGCKDGVVDLLEIKEGQHYPKKIIDEQFVFDE